MVSGVSYIETGTGKCSFQGCIPTGNSGLWSGWEDASLCLAEPSYTCWVSRFNCHHCMAEGVLAGQAQAAVELPCLLPCSPGHLWSPGPLSTWVGLPLAASAPSPCLCLNSSGASATPTFCHVAVQVGQLKKLLQNSSIIPIYRYLYLYIDRVNLSKAPCTFGLQA